MGPNSISGTGIMKYRLTWNQIKDNFAGLWVELVDFEWDWSRSYPKHAKVKNFAGSRMELLNSVSGDDSVILFVGKAESLVQHDAENQVSL